VVLAVAAPLRRLYKITYWLIDVNILFFNAGEHSQTPSKLLLLVYTCNWPLHTKQQPVTEDISSHTNPNRPNFNFMQFIDNIAEHTALFPLQLLLLLQLSCLRRSPFALYSAVVVAATAATGRHSNTMTSLLLWRHLHCRHIPCLTSAHNNTCSIDEQFIPVHASDYGYTCEVLINYSYEQTAMFTVSSSTCLRHTWWHFITIYIWKQHAKLAPINGRIK